MTEPDALPAPPPAAATDRVSQGWRALRAEPGAAARWFDLAQAYRDAALPWQATYAARQALRCDAAWRRRLEAAGLAEGGAPSEGDDGRLGRPDLPDAPTLAGRFRQAVADAPGDWLSWLYLARLLDLPGVAGAALPAPQHALEQARALEPIAGETLHRLGVWRLDGGDAAGAVAALAGLVDLRPLRYGSMMFLGEALLRVGKTAAAEAAFSRASLSPNPDFLLDLAQRVYGHNYWQEAIEVLKKALALRPASVPVHLALAKIQSEVYLLADCRDSLRALRELDPDHREARLLEAGLCGRMGDAHGHLASLQQAYADGGDPLSRLASSVAMTALYHDALPADELAALHRRVCAPIEAAYAPRRDFANERTTGRRLRVGYVSGDFHRQHPVNIFMLPVLLRHDHAACEVFVYHTGAMHDEYTRQAQAAADGWREAQGLDDAALQRQIVADRIDVLVDLAGHTSTHRLGVFALRAAPVQATFLGYPYSTGLSTIDWLIGDPTVTPAGDAALYSEGIAQLPHSVFCWAPVDAYPLPPARPADAPVVFGSFNNAMKLSPTTIALWARVLHAVPGSRLLLKAPSLRDDAVRARFGGLFAAHGVAAGRLEFRGPTGLPAMMQEYGEIDVGLDPTPYNGGTTTLQALWMGVPVVTLAGRNFVGRMGASFLRTIGRPEWIAADADDYVAQAAHLAETCPLWRPRRGELRARMQASPLCDIGAYVAGLEALYRRMWHAYCQGSRARLLAPPAADPDNETTT